MLCGKLGKKKAEVNAILSDEMAPTMTVEEIDERDPKGEIRGWLKDMTLLIEHDPDHQSTTKNNQSEMPAHD